MTPAAFTQWLADIQSAGLARSEFHALQQLGYTSRRSGANLKRSGGTVQLALACAALIAGIKPYGE